MPPINTLHLVCSMCYCPMYMLCLVIKIQCRVCISSFEGSRPVWVWKHKRPFQHIVIHWRSRHNSWRTEIHARRHRLPLHDHESVQHRGPWRIPQVLPEWLRLSSGCDNSVKRCLRWLEVQSAWRFAWILRCLVTWDFRICKRSIQVQDKHQRLCFAS